MSTNKANDIDPAETREWLEALQSVISYEGNERAVFLLKQLIKNANASGVKLASSIHTPYRNTLTPHKEEKMPPDDGMGKRINALIRWNAVAMVVRAGKYAAELGGHIASYASASTLYEVGFNYFFVVVAGILEEVLGIDVMIGILFVVPEVGL